MIKNTKSHVLSGVLRLEDYKIDCEWIPKKIKDVCPIRNLALFQVSN